MSSTTVLPPPPTVVTHDGRGGGWVLLCRAPSDIEAHLLSGRLETAGIETQRVADHSDGQAWLHNGSSPFMPIDVWVRRNQLEDARIVLAEIAFDQPAHEQGKRVSRWKELVVWWVAALSLGLALTAIGWHRMAQYLDSLR